VAQALQHNHTLTQLKLSGNKIGAEGAHAVAQALQHNHTLTQLKLSDNQIGVEGAHAVAQALQHNHTLTHLGIRGNKIGAEGGLALVQALQHNRTLTHLDLGYCGPETGATREEAMLFAQHHMVCQSNEISSVVQEFVSVSVKNSREEMRRCHQILSDLIGDEQSLISILPYDMSIINEIIRMADESIPDVQVSFIKGFRMAYI
jgi:hypothetical protein